MKNLSSTVALLAVGITCAAALGAARAGETNPAATVEGGGQAINYGLVGAWFNQATAGQGFLIDINPADRFMFVPWFTFDTLSPQDGGVISGQEQVWFTAQGNYAGNRAELTVFATIGGVFDDDTAVSNVAVGTMIIQFSSCTAATLNYDFPDLGLAGSIPITKLLADEICTRINNGEISGKALAAEQSAPIVPLAGNARSSAPVHPRGASQAINYGLVGGWFNTATPGQGFMFDFLLEGNIMFVAWFTFDAAVGAGNLAELRWFTAQGNFSGNRAELDVTQTRNGVFDSGEMPLNQTVGTMTIEFSSCTTGNVSYNLSAFNRSGNFPINKLLGDEICTRINNGEINLGGGDPGGGAKVQGRLTYDRVPFAGQQSGLDYCAIRQEPARGIIVQALDANNTTSVLGETSTDGNGNFSIDLPDNRNVVVRVVAAMVRTGQPAWDFRVVDNTNGKAVYTLATAAFASGTGTTTLNLNASSGFVGNCNNVGTMAYAEPRAAAPFAILDGVYQSYEKVLAVDPTRQFTPLLINWSVNNVPADGDEALGQISTSNFNSGQLFILGADGVDTDEYDDHVIIHEWGHYFEATLSRSDSIGGQHGTGDRLDPRVAFGEGFGNALSAIITDDPLYLDSAAAGNQMIGVAQNLEDNNDPTPGWYSEGSVQSILYDLYDSNNESGDTVALGFGPIYQVLRNQQRTTGVFTTIFSFLDGLKTNHPNQAAAIDNLAGRQNIAPVADAFGSTEMNNAGSVDVLPLYTQHLADGTNVRVCSIADFGLFNKLSNRRFVDFQAPSDGAYTITVTPVSGASGDAAFAVYRMGNQVGDVVDRSNPGGAESVNVNLTAGLHIVEVFEFANVQGQGAGRNCFDVTIAGN